VGVKKGTLIAIVIVAILGVWGVSAYNRLGTLDQAVQTQWVQVENVYQRRLDLVPDLVETVKRVAAYEKDTYTAVAEARSRAGQTTARRDVIASAEAFDRFQQAHAELSSAVGRLLAVAERYPELKTSPRYRELLGQLESNDARIADGRMRFNEAAQAFNARRRAFPTVLIAGLTGFREKPYFRASGEAALSSSAQK
jgi:LemA protein